MYSNIVWRVFSANVYIHKYMERECTCSAEILRIEARFARSALAMSAKSATSYCEKDRVRALAGRRQGKQKLLPRRESTVQSSMFINSVFLAARLAENSSAGGFTQADCRIRNIELTLHPAREGARSEPCSFGTTPRIRVSALMNFAATPESRR